MVHIITDSAADFEPAEYGALNVTCIPLTVFFGEREYQENVDLSKEHFYSLLKETCIFPKTAQASPQLLQDLFENAHAKGDEAIYITLSSALSGTWQNAMMVKSLLGYDSCYVVDSRNATGGQRMIVELAVKLRDEGKSAAEIVAGIEAIRERIVLFACIDTLEYLYLGGRISHTAYKLGSVAQIKPIIHVDRDGGIAVPSKAVGTRKGMELLCKKVEQFRPDPAFPFYVMYTPHRANGDALADKLRAMGIDVPAERIIPVGAAIGSHIGPNGCGFVYVH